MTAAALLPLPVLSGSAVSIAQTSEQINRNLYTPYPELPDRVRLESFRNEPAPSHKPKPREDEPFAWSRIATPPISALPWTRWWWPGGAVDSKQLRDELADLKAANFGGVEVQPFILGVAAPETVQRAHSFDTPAYYATLNAMLDDAGQLGMTVDLNNLGGWTAGGPHVGLDDAPQELALASTEFAGGKTVRIRLPLPEPTASDWGRAKTGPAYFSPGRAKLMSVIVARKSGGGHSADIDDLRDQVRLDPATSQVLTGKVKNGVLEWAAPTGRWFLVASYIMPDTEPPSFSASERPGLLTDILRSDITLAHNNYAFGKRTGLPRHYGRSLRGIFNDGFEIKANRLTSADFLGEFKRRRGYDLEPFLPAVWVNGRDNFFFYDLIGIHAVPLYHFGPFDERIRYDYQRTLSDLIIERFVRVSRQWSEARGLTSRGQTFGFDLDVIAGLGETSIPDTEQLYAGGGEAFLKLASSAAALYGRKLVGSESFVWEGYDYTTTAGKVKAAADKLFLAGVNHIFYHGTPYGMDRGEQSATGPQGWFPFSQAKSATLPTIAFSDNFSAGAAIWADIPQLNSYIGRSQNLLRQGEPDIDVLIYYPFLGYPSNGHAEIQKSEPLQAGKFPFSDPLPPPPAPVDPASAKFLANLPREPDPRIEWLKALRPAIDELDRRGITWGWVNGDALRTRRLLPGGRLSSGGRYGSLLLANVESAPVEDLEALRALKSGGAAVLTFGALPRRQPGFLDAAHADERARVLGAQIADRKAPLHGVSLLADRIAENSRSTVAVRPEVGTIRRYSRALSEGGSIHFLANQHDSAARAGIRLRGTDSAWWFDPVSGKGWPATVGAREEVSASLAPFESRFLIAGVPLPETLAGTAPPAARAEALRSWSLERWSVRTDRRNRPSGPLFDWSKDPEWRYAADPALYSTTLSLSKSADLRYVLELGLVPGSASVMVNGKDAGSASLPPGRLDVTALLQSGNNRIDIRYNPSQRNGFVGKAMAGDKRYLRFKTEGPGPIVSAGLLTPIRLRAFGAD